MQRISSFICGLGQSPETITMKFYVMPGTSRAVYDSIVFSAPPGRWRNPTLRLNMSPSDQNLETPPLGGGSFPEGELFPSGL